MPALHDNKANHSHASPASSFPFFSHLPREIADQIILLACRSWHSSLAPDVSTTHSLSLVSKPIHDLVNPLLYEVIGITRPSSLVELVETLEERPELGKLVKHLHVGAEDTLVPGDWPLVMEESEEGVEMQYPVLWLKTSLNGEEELPRWCEPGKQWCLEGAGRVDCREAAVRGAIEAALQALDVEPYEKGYARSGGKIGLPEWAVRVYLLQACLDLYLIEMRRIKDTEGYAVCEHRSAKAASPQDPPICRLGKCSHYPHLALLQQDGIAPEQNFNDKTTLKLSTRKLWRHLTRRGASMDHFNHPIKFASGVDAGHVNEYGKDLIMLDLEGPNRGYFEPEDFDPDHDDSSDDSDAEQEENVDANAKGPSFLPDDRHRETQERGKTSGLMKGTTYTAVGTMAAASELLLLTPNVVNLSLNGHLHLAFLMDDLDVMEKVKSLSLGPLLPFWDGGAFSTGWDGPALRSLENLRVAGMMLDEEEACRIAGRGRGLPELKRFQWEMVSTTHPNRTLRLHVPSLNRCVCILQGQNDTDDDDLEDLEDLEDSTDSTCAGAYSEPSRLLEIALHPDDVSALLGHAPPQLRTAWQTGSRLNDGSAPHRVRLVESEAAKTDPLAHRSVAIERLHGAARRWWEECGTAEEEKRAGREEEEEDWMPNAGKRLEKEESSEDTPSLKEGKEDQQRTGSTLFWFQ